jgi:hypothetical protein
LELTQIVVTSGLEDEVAVVRVCAGVCGFVTRVKADRENRRDVRIAIESDCESVLNLGFFLEQLGALTMKDIMSTDREKNSVLRASGETLPHAACPVPVAVLKACEVAQGLCLPRPVTIDFEDESSDKTTT